MPTVHRCSRGNWTRGNWGNSATDRARGGRGLWPQVLCLQALAVAGVALYAGAASAAPHIEGGNSRECRDTLIVANALFYSKAFELDDAVTLPKNA